MFGNVCFNYYINGAPKCNKIQYLRSTPISNKYINLASTPICNEYIHLARAHGCTGEWTLSYAQFGKSGRVGQ